jgi:hypothetical protein
MRVGIVLGVAACAGCSLLLDTSGFSDEERPSGDASTTTGADAGTGPDGAAADARPDVVNAGPALIGDWPFDEGTGTTAMDVSGHDHHAVLFGGTWGADRAGSSGRALHFAGGANDYASVAAHADFDRPTGAKLTMMAWVRFDDTPSHDIVFNVAFGGTEATYGIEVESATTLTYWDGNTHVAEATIPNVVGAWHHFGVVVDGAQARVYFDGARVGQGTADVTPRVATQILFGHSNWGDYLVGAIDQARFYRAALTDAELLAEKNR